MRMVAVFALHLVFYLHVMRVKCPNLSARDSVERGGDGDVKCSSTEAYFTYKGIRVIAVSSHGTVLCIMCLGRNLKVSDNKRNAGYGSARDGHIILTAARLT